MGMPIHPLVLGHVFDTENDRANAADAMARFAHQANDTIDDEKPVDVCWLVDHDHMDQVRILNGPAQGLALGELIEQAPRRIVGRHYDAGTPFPLSIAIRSVGGEQPLRVHPDEETARKLDGYNRMNAEFWYALAAERNARVFLGLDPRASAQQFIQNLHGPESQKYLQRFNVRTGDSYLVLPGTVHTLAGEQLLLEMALSNQPALRLAHWNEDDKVPEAELDAAIRSVNPESRQVLRMPKVRGTVPHTRKIPLTRHCPFFTVEEIRLLDHIYMETSDEAFELLFALDGEFTVEHSAGKESVGRNRLCLMPAGLGSFKLVATNGPAEILRFSPMPQ